MKIEKIDQVAFGARDVDEASSSLSQPLNTKFDRMEPVIWGEKWLWRFVDKTFALSEERFSQKREALKEAEFDKLIEQGTGSQDSLRSFAVQSLWRDDGSLTCGLLAQQDEKLCLRGARYLTQDKRLYRG